MRKLFVLIAILFGLFPTYAYSFMCDGLYYNILSDEESVAVTFRTTDYDSYIGEITIPSEVSYGGKTYTVKEIGDRAFYKCSTVTSITIPKTITKIGICAFEDANHIQRVNISDLTAWCMIDCNYSPLKYGGVLYLNNRPVDSLESLDSKCTKIGESAFYGNTYLTKVVIPEFVTEVCQDAFYGCSNMTYLEVGSNVELMGEGAFRKCSSLSTIKFNDSDKELKLARYMNNYIYSYFKDSPLKSVYVGRKIDWETNGNIEYYRPFTTVTQAVLNYSGYSGVYSGFGNALVDLYLGPKCTEIRTVKSSLENMYVFANDIETVNCSMAITNLYVVDSSNISESVAALSYKKVFNLIDLINLKDDDSFVYGSVPVLDSSNFINNVPNMEIDISSVGLEQSTGYYNFGLKTCLKNDLWSVEFNVPYTYNITPAPLTIIANNASRAYGEENPTFSCSYFGFKNSDTEDVLKVKPKVETSASVKSQVGTYPIIPYGAEAKNYTFSYERGTLTINKADQKITWNQTFNDICVGDIVELKAESSSGLAVKYSATDESIADIYTEDGKAYVEFLKTGEVYIRANQFGDANYNESDRVSKKIAVSEARILVSNLSIDPNEWSGNELSTFRIIASILPENATNKTLVWTSSDESVATVDDNGNVSILTPGDCVITVKTTDGSNISAECKIKAVSAIESIMTGDDNQIVDVYNTNGVLVSTLSLKDSLNRLPAGLYLIKYNGVFHKVIIR